MKKTIKFTPAKLASLKHPIGKHPDKWYDSGCTGLSVFVMPQPSLTKVFYASWSVVTYGADGKQKRSGRYKYLGRVGGSKNLEAIKQEIVNNLPIWKAHNITTQSGKTVTSLVVEYMKSGASTGNRIKTKGTKLKYKTVTDKFDRPENANFRGKVGYNDTGIPLTPKAAKKQRNNRAGYHYPHHLQVINENRKKAAMDRHGITDPDNPYNLKKKKVSAQPAVRSNRSSYWSLPMAPSPRKKEYHYYSNDPAPPPEPVTYILPYEPKSREPVYKSTGKFPKIDEAIAAAKKKY